MLGIPVVPRDYLDVKKCDKAVENILKVLKPGDVINTEAQLQSWWDVELSIGWKGIWVDQKYAFGEQARWKDEHTTLFLEPLTVLSVEPPRATYLRIRNFCLDKITIYRYTKWPKFDAKDIEMMAEFYKPIWHTKYDYGQLIDILINTLFYDDPDTQKVKIFDHAKTEKVCSVGVRVVYERWIKWKNESLPAGKKLEKLFRRLNPKFENVGHVKDKYFSAKRERPGVDIEMTTPAHFANSDFFSNEFERVALFEQGERVE